MAPVGPSLLGASISHLKMETILIFPNSQICQETQCDVLKASLLFLWLCHCDRKK